MFSPISCLKQNQSEVLLLCTLPLLREMKEAAAQCKRKISHEKPRHQESQNLSVSSMQKKPLSVLETWSSLQAPDLCKSHKSQQDFRPTETEDKDERKRKELAQLFVYTQMVIALFESNCSQNSVVVNLLASSFVDVKSFNCVMSGHVKKLQHDKEVNVSEEFFLLKDRYDRKWIL